MLFVCTRIIHPPIQRGGGHSEEIEVSDEVAAAFAQLEKYEKKVEHKKHVAVQRFYIVYIMIKIVKLFKKV